MNTESSMRARQLPRDFRELYREGLQGNCPEEDGARRIEEHDVNTSHDPNFLGQPVARACGPCDRPKSWICCRGSVVVVPVTSIPTETLQSQRPMPKNRHACVCRPQELSLSRADAHAAMRETIDDGRSLGMDGVG